MAAKEDIQQETTMKSPHNEMPKWNVVHMLPLRNWIWESNLGSSQGVVKHLLDPPKDRRCWHRRLAVWWSVLQAGWLQFCQNVRCRWREQSPQGPISPVLPGLLSAVSLSVFPC